MGETLSFSPCRFPRRLVNPSFMGSPVQGSWQATYRASSVATICFCRAMCVPTLVWTSNTASTLLSRAPRMEDTKSKPGICQLPWGPLATTTYLKILPDSPGLPASSAPPLQLPWIAVPDPPAAAAITASLGITRSRAYPPHSPPLASRLVPAAIQAAGPAPRGTTHRLSNRSKLETQAGEQGGHGAARDGRHAGAAEFPAQRGSGA